MKAGECGTERHIPFCSDALFACCDQRRRSGLPDRRRTASSANGRIPEQWPERCTDRVIRRASRRANRSWRIRPVDPSPRIFSRRKMCLWQRFRRHWGIARSRLRCAICVWTWGALRFSPGAAASDCLPGLTTDRIPGISSYIKEKALIFSAFKCPGQDSNLHERNCSLPPQSSVSTNFTTWADLPFPGFGVQI